MRDWWRSLERRPEELTRGEWRAVIAATLVAAISRVLAMARTPWDWDELLFMRALDHFDVASHRPHPPGFPLFILAAKMVRGLGLSDFHSLQALNLIAAMAIVPAMFFLCRELRMRAWTSLAAALMLAFFPNVWIYGAGGFSDVPSMTLIVTALGLLFAGCRSDRAYIMGALVLAISAGFRPQNVLVGFVPLLIASWFRRRREVFAAVGIIAAVIAVSYGAAAWLTGWSEYREALEVHRAYILRVDSFLSPTRPPLWRVFDDFFVIPYRAPTINAIVAVLALIGIIRRRPPALVMLAAFGPLCIFSWLMLDHFSASRFSIGYAPLMAILAALGIEGLELAVFPATVILMIVWAWPAVMEIRSTISPPVAAIEWIRDHVDKRGATIYVDAGMVPFAEWYLSDYPIEPIAYARPPAAFGRGELIWLRENPRPVPRRRLWDILRHRYYDVSASAADSQIVFGSGWYAEERHGSQAWRWMGAHSVATLPPLAGRAHLSLQLYVPLDALNGAPVVTVGVNGIVVDRFRASSRDIARDVVVTAHGDRPNELTIDTDRAVVPAAKQLSGDRRALGLRVNSIGWMAPE